MNTIMRSLFVVASTFAIVHGAISCTKIEENNANENGEVYVTLTAEKGDVTRTSLTQDGTNMIVKWSTGDKLYAVGETDGLLGSLTLTEGNEATTGKFGGTIKYVSTKQTVRFYYVGKGKSISDNTYTLNLASQTGTLDDIVNNLHLMSGSVSNITPTTVNLGTVTMGNVISIAKVNTAAAFGAASGIKLSGSVNKGVLNLKTGIVTPTSGDITLSGTASNNYYLALLANGTSQSLHFSKDAISASLNAKTIVQGKFYSNNGNSIAL